MPKRVAWWVCCMPLFAACSPPAPRRYEVLRVQDGDSFVARTSQGVHQTVRLHAIDAPEQGQPYGKQAKQCLAASLSGTLEVEQTDTDRYGRVIAEVRVDGRRLNAMLVEQGCAWWYRQHAPKDRELELAERSARRAKLGLWAKSQPQPPWEYRASRRRNP